MLFAVVILGVGIAVWVFAGKVLLSVRKQGRTAALMRETETTRAAEVSGLAAGTAVEVTGLLRCEEPVESEMAGQNCAGLPLRITVGKGEAKAYVDTVDGKKAGGRVSDDKPLRISAVVSIDEEDEEVSVNLEVLGKEVRDLTYEARVAPQD